MGKIAPAVGGKGGGRPNMALGGGKDVAGLDRALELADYAGWRALFDNAKAAAKEQLGDEFSAIHDAAMAVPLEEALREGGVLAVAPAS